LAPIIPACPRRCPRPADRQYDAGDRRHRAFDHHRPQDRQGHGRPRDRSEHQKATTYEAKVIFLCASTIGSAQILLQSRNEANPRGLANSSDQVGRNLMDHVYGPRVMGLMSGPETYHRAAVPTASTSRAIAIWTPE
jgi:choline dehydrogenase-like flavoprotein